MVPKLQTLLLCLILLVLLAGQIFPQESQFREAVPLEQISVQLPDEAKKTGLSGIVFVEAKLSATGEILSLGRVIGPGHVCPDVSRSDVLAIRAVAREAVLTSRFSPAISYGRPTASTVLVSVEFPEGGSLIGSRHSAKVEDRPPITIGHYPPGPSNWAKSLPKPEYPKSARAVRADGPVTVEVLVQEDGTVFSASSSSGHPLLRHAARESACKAKFSPIELSGRPVRVRTTLIYNFAL